MSQAKPPPASTRQRFRWSLVFLTAAVLEGVAGCQVWRLWHRLPGVQVQRISPKTYQAAFERARRQASPEAQEGLLAVELSRRFTAALLDVEARRPPDRETVQLLAGRMHRTLVGRLQLAAFKMLELERAGVPVVAWWPRLEPLLAGLQQARFPHYLPDVLALHADVLRDAGLSRGAAAMEARQVLGHPHGPFLQYFCARLERVAAAREDAGDPSAQRCRTLLRNLLRGWVSDPAPAGLRLLAADLLARNLEATAAADTTGDGKAFPADELRSWREHYRNLAKTNVLLADTKVPHVSLQMGPEPDPRLYRALVLLLAVTLWTAGAGLAATGAAVVCLAAAATTRRPYPSSFGRVLFAATLMVGVVFSFLAGVAVWWPERAAADLRCLTEDGLGWPRLPWAAAAVTLVILSVAALAKSPAPTPFRDRLVRVAHHAGFVCIGLAVGALGLTAWSGRVLTKYEQVIQAALEGDELVTVWGKGDPSRAPVMKQRPRWNPDLDQP